MTPQRALERVQALLRGAVDPASPEEEARSKAVQAARLMKAHGLIVVGKGEARAPAPSSNGHSQGGYAPAPAPRSYRGVGGGFFKFYEATAAGTCQSCRRGFRKGERIGWRNPIGPVHTGC